MCRPTQHFIISRSATCFSSHEPSSGTPCYINLKNTGISEHAFILLERQGNCLLNEQHRGTTRNTAEMSVAVLFSSTQARKELYITESKKIIHWFPKSTFFSMKTTPKRSTFYNLCQKARTRAGKQHKKQDGTGRIGI